MNNVTYTYIEIIEQESSGKTKRFQIRNRKSGKVIGEIKWYSHWRQYCFFPLGGTVFSAGCMKDIQGFISRAMDDYANAVYKERQAVK